MPLAISARRAQDLPEPPITLVVGGVVRAYLDAFRRAAAGEAVEDSVDDLVTKGVSAAYAECLAGLEKSTDRLRNAARRFDEHTAPAGPPGEA